MLKIRSYILILVLIVIPFLSFSQGIRINYIGYTSFESVNAPYSTFWGIGYEQNLNSRISIALDYNVGYSLGDDVSDYYDNSTGNSGITFNYSHDLPWTEFSYTSKYFFSDNDDQAWYISSGIAYRKVDYVMDVYNVSYEPAYASEATEILKGATNETITFFPISFKVGHRGSMDGWFGDINFGISYIPGASSQGSGNKTIDKYVDGGFRSLTFNVGLLVGLGWAE